MLNPFDVIKTHKCMKCFHAELCTRYICGANLDLAAADCRYFKEIDTIIEMPKKFWLVFNVPGFYDITEYGIDKVLIEHGKISKMWGTSKHSKDVVYAEDFGRLVFFSREAAEAGLKKLIEENKINGEM